MNPIPRNDIPRNDIPRTDSTTKQKEPQAEQIVTASATSTDLRVDRSFHNSVEAVREPERTTLRARRNTLESIMNPFSLLAIQPQAPAQVKMAASSSPTQMPRSQVTNDPQVLQEPLRITSASLQQSLSAPWEQVAFIVKRLSTHSRADLKKKLQELQQAMQRAVLPPSSTQDRVASPRPEKPQAPAAASTTPRTHVREHSSGFLSDLRQRLSSSAKAKERPTSPTRAVSPTRSLSPTRALSPRRRAEELDKPQAVALVPRSMSPRRDMVSPGRNLSPERVREGQQNGTEPVTNPVTHLVTDSATGPGSGGRARFTEPLLMQVDVRDTAISARIEQLLKLIEESAHFQKDFALMHAIEDNAKVEGLSLWDCLALANESVISTKELFSLVHNRLIEVRPTALARRRICLYLDFCTKWVHHNRLTKLMADAYPILEAIVGRMSRHQEELVRERTKRLLEEMEGRGPQEMKIEPKIAHSISDNRTDFEMNILRVAKTSPASGDFKHHKEQFCLDLLSYTKRLLERMSEDELYVKKWSNRPASTVKYQQYCDRLNSYVGDAISRETDTTNRTHVVAFFVQVAHRCLELGDIASATHIFWGLPSSERIAEEMSGYSLYQQLAQAFDLGSNFSTLRSLLDLLLDPELGSRQPERIQKLPEILQNLPAIREHKRALCIPLLQLIAKDLEVMGEVVPKVIVRDGESYYNLEYLRDVAKRIKSFKQLVDLPVVGDIKLPENFQTSFFMKEFARYGKPLTG